MPRRYLFIILIILIGIVGFSIYTIYIRQFTDKPMYIEPPERQEEIEGSTVLPSVSEEGITYLP